MKWKFTYFHVDLLNLESSQGWYEEKLIDDIFTGRRYNKLARPVENETEALRVNFGLSLQQVVDLVRGMEGSLWWR